MSLKHIKSSVTMECETYESDTLQVAVRNNGNMFFEIFVEDTGEFHCVEVHSVEHMREIAGVLLQALEIKE